MKLLFLDFDETMFSHHNYLEWFDDFLEKYGVRNGAFSERIEEFHDPVGPNLRMYRHADHMEAVAERSWSFMAGETEKALKIDQPDFCYPEVHEFLESVIKQGYKPSILTYGNAEYQRFKIATCSSIKSHRLPVYVVNEQKAEFLKREFGSEEGILVDDKHPLKLPANWQHIWIRRGKKPESSGSRASDGAIVITDLMQFRELTL